VEALLCNLFGFFLRQNDTVSLSFILCFLLCLYCHSEYQELCLLSSLIWIFLVRMTIKVVLFKVFLLARYVILRNLKNLCFWTVWFFLRQNDKVVLLVRYFYYANLSFWGTKNLCLVCTQMILPSSEWQSWVVWGCLECAIYLIMLRHWLALLQLVRILPSSEWQSCIWK
jgi:hypothetical protein